MAFEHITKAIQNQDAYYVFLHHIAIELDVARE
jgi:hypothetical protein